MDALTKSALLAKAKIARDLGSEMQKLSDEYAEAGDLDKADWWHDKAVAKMEEAASLRKRAYGEE